MTQANIEAIRVMVLGLAALLFCVVLGVSFHHVEFVRALTVGIGTIAMIIATAGAKNLRPTIP